MLPSLDGDAGEGTEENLVVGGTEAVAIRRFPQFLLALERNTDLVQFGSEFGIVGWKGDETGEGAGSILVTTLLDEPPRRFWKEDHADSENETPNELKGDGKLPRSATGPVLGGVVDDGGEEKTDRDRPLITSNNSATVSAVQGVGEQSGHCRYERAKAKGNLPNPFGGTLGLIHGDQHRDHSDTPTGEDTTHDEERNSGGSGLHRDTSGEDEDGEDNGPPSTEDICGRGGGESTKEGTCRQDGDDEGLLRRGDGAYPSDWIWFAEGTQPVLHCLNTGDDTGVITEEDTAKGGEEGLRTMVRTWGCAWGEGKDAQRGCQPRCSWVRWHRCQGLQRLFLRT